MAEGINVIYDPELDPEYQDSLNPELSPLERSVRSKRRRIEQTGVRADGGTGFEDLAADQADVALRNVVTGRVGAARRGSTKTALGLLFSPEAEAARQEKLKASKGLASGNASWAGPGFTATSRGY